MNNRTQGPATTGEGPKLIASVLTNPSVAHVNDATQYSILTAIFLVLIRGLSEPAALVLLPGSVLLSLVRLAINSLGFSKAKNKNFENTSNYVVGAFTAIAELVAMIIFFATTGVVAPALYLTYNCVGFVNCFSRVLYHGYQCIKLDKNSALYAEHLAKLKSFSLGSITSLCLIIGVIFLFLAPHLAAGTIAIGASAALALKISIGSILAAIGLNSLSPEIKKLLLIIQGDKSLETEISPEMVKQLEIELEKNKNNYANDLENSTNKICEQLDLKLLLSPDKEYTNTLPYKVTKNKKVYSARNEVFATVQGAAEYKNTIECVIR
jgi:hypothetical protein